MSRDDIGRFLPAYSEHEIVPNDPVPSIDQNGVGQLMKIARRAGRKTRPNIKLGICGEHGGDPSSVKFCHEVGLDYVSCSPVPRADRAARRGPGRARRVAPLSDETDRPKGSDPNRIRTQGAASRAGLDTSRIF